VATESCLLNGRANGVDFPICTDNLIGSPCDEFDVILVGDMLYDAGLSETIVDWLTRLARRGKTCFIGDPGRGTVTTTSPADSSGQLYPLAKYELDKTTKEDNYGFNQAFVFTLML